MAEEALESSTPKANFNRLTRLLIRGGGNFLRETLDSFYSPANLHLKLTDPGTEKTLNLSLPQRACLYPFPGKTGESKDFDITLTFKLLKKICGLTEPPGGWNDLPSDSEETLEADLARINYYRNEVYAHHITMEISNKEFVDLWERIKEALLRIATKVCPEKRDEWKKSIDHLLRNPLTPDEERCIEELESWYMQDMDLKYKMERLEEKVMFLITLILDTRKNGHGHNQAAGSEPEPEQATGADDPDFWTVILSFRESVDLFFKYLWCRLHLPVRNHKVGSWHITVECSSLQVLEGLWEDYRSGHLNSVAQEMLITPQVLEKLGLTELKLRTFISEDQYERGKKLLEASSGAVDESDIQSAVQATITKPISEGSIEPDLLARISTLERENVELKEIVKAMEGKFQSDRASLERISKIEQENIELRRLVEANQESRRLKEKDYDERMLSLQMRSLDTEASFGQVLFELSEEYGLLPPSRWSLGRRPTLTLGAFGNGFCQIIINRTTQEELVGEMDEIVRVFEELDYHVDKATCTPSDGIEKVVESIAARGYQYRKIFVCFILSNLTENMEMESVKGGAFNVKDLMGMFSPLHCPQLSGRKKVFIFLVHQKAGIKASESKYSVSKTLTAHLPFHGLCLFVPYSQGYLSTLLTKIKLNDSDLDLLTILEEAKKSFYKETNITIPDPVHNFNERVFLA